MTERKLKLLGSHLELSLHYVSVFHSSLLHSGHLIEKNTISALRHHELTANSLMRDAETL